MIVFIDDILVYSQRRKEHEQHLRIVLYILEESKPFAKFKKCEFWLDRVSFLSHVVSNDGISIDLSKVEVVVRWKRLTIVTKLRSFLGLGIIEVS